MDLRDKLGRMANPRGLAAGGAETRGPARIFRLSADKAVELDLAAAGRWSPGYALHSALKKAGPSPVWAVGLCTPSSGTPRGKEGQGRALGCRFSGRMTETAGAFQRQ